MLHFQLLFYIISFASGWASMTGTILSYRHHKKQGALYFTLLLLSLTLIQLELIAYLYLTLIDTEIVAVRNFAQFVDICGMTLMIFTLPRLIKTSLGMELGSWDRRISLILALFCSSLMVLRYLFKLDVLRIIPLIIFYGAIAWTVVVFIQKMKDIGNKQFKNMYRTLGITSLCFLPLVALEHIRPHIPLLEPLIWLEALSVPLFFLVLNIEAILLGLPFFDAKPGLKNGMIIEDFCKEFSITEREKEVAQLYVKGRTFVEIGEELFISPRTVDKHVENLYSKTGVKNRAQLIHLLLGST